MNSINFIYIFKGRIPSKKNSKQIRKNRYGQSFIASSDDYKNWHDKTIFEILKYKGFFEGEKGLNILAIFYSGDNRKYDLSNKFESIADLLVDAGVIDDDNYSVLSKVQIEFGGVDKEKEGCEVWIRQLEE